MASLRHGGADDDSYDTAQVCRGGHLITRYVEQYPRERQDFCSMCGEPTLMQCEHCSTPIKGHLRGAMPAMSEPPPPKFCHGCGSSYPWTEKALADANAMADELDLTPEDREALKVAVKDLVRETSLPLAGSRFKRIIAKAGPQAGGMFKEILIGVLSNAAQKQMGLG